MTSRRGILFGLWASVALLAGCDDGPTETPDPLEPVDLSGIWDFTEVLIRANQPVVCRDTGSYRLTDDGNRILGEGEKSGTCQGLVNDFSDARTFSVTEGFLRDTVVEFVLTGGCGLGNDGPIDARYEGVVERGPPLRMSGRSTCSVAFNGSWEATLAAPTASLALQPDSAPMVLDEIIHLGPILHSASGARLFERTLEWTTADPAVATVDSNGLVTGVGVGSTAIEVSSAGLSATSIVEVTAVRFESVEAGGYHTCGLSQKGEVFCWGANDAGQAGPSASYAPCPGVSCRRAPGLVPASVSYASLESGTLSTCALSFVGDAYCWGANSLGQLGLGVTSQGANTPQEVSADESFFSISLGGGHACAVDQDGVVHCWGSNNRGQTGPGQGYGPNPLTFPAGFRMVTAGGLHSCGLAIDGATYCWGWNWDGQLGNDTVVASAEPMSVSGDLDFEFIATGSAHNCGLTASGTAYCWGDGAWGQLGIEAVDYVAVPVAVSGGHSFTQLATGAYHTCGLVEDGTAYCWGEGSYGRLGDGADEGSHVPVAVSGGLRFSSITTGAEHTCAMGLDERAYCWGSNFNGQLGRYPTQFSTTPQKVAGQP